MLIAKIENGKVSAVAHYQQLFPNCSFPSNGPSNEWMQENNCLEVITWKQHDNSTQKLSPIDPYIEDEQVYTVIVVEKTQEELNAQTAAAASQVRAQRDHLLAESDWTQGKDIPDEISSVWAVYRQALRDITSQAGFPTDVAFPAKPE